MPSTLSLKPETCRSRSNAAMRARIASASALAALAPSALFQAPRVLLMSYISK